MKEPPRSRFLIRSTSDHLLSAASSTLSPKPEAHLIWLYSGLSCDWGQKWKVLQKQQTTAQLTFSCSMFGPLVIFGSCPFRVWLWDKRWISPLKRAAISFRWRNCVFSPIEGGLVSQSKCKTRAPLPTCRWAALKWSQGSAPTNRLQTLGCSETDRRHRSHCNGSKFWEISQTAARTTHLNASRWSTEFSSASDMFKDEKYVPIKRSFTCHERNQSCKKKLKQKEANFDVFRVVWLATIAEFGTRTLHRRRCVTEDNRMFK